MRYPEPTSSPVSSLWGTFINPVEERRYRNDTRLPRLLAFRRHALFVAALSSVVLADVQLFSDVGLKWRSLDDRQDGVSDRAFRRCAASSLLSAALAICAGLVACAHAMVVRVQLAASRETRPCADAAAISLGKKFTPLLSAPCCHAAVVEALIVAGLGTIWTALAAAAALQHAGLVGSLSFIAAGSFMLTSTQHYNPLPSWKFTVAALLLPCFGTLFLVAKYVGGLNAIRGLDVYVLAVQFLSLPNSIRAADIQARRRYAAKNASALLEAKELAVSAPSALELAATEEALGSDLLAPAMEELRRRSIPWRSVRLKSKLGVGAMGEVWLGAVVGVMGDVAVKRLQRSRAASATAVASFLAEAVWLSTLQHPTIIAIKGVQLEPPFTSVVLELAGGGSLRSLLQAPGKLGAPTWRRDCVMLRIAQEAAAALAFCHENGVLHKDVKAANILLSRTLGARLADFGSAAAVSADNPQSHAPLGVLQGLSVRSRLSQAPSTGGVTVLWCAPEVLRSEPFKAASDVWSFGVLLFEMVERRSPYSDKPAAVAILEIAQGGLRPELSVVSEGGPPAQLVQLVARCFHPTAASRPSAAEVLEALAAMSVGYLTPAGFGFRGSVGNVPAGALDDSAAPVNTAGALDCYSAAPANMLAASVTRHSLAGVAASTMGEIVDGALVDGALTSAAMIAASSASSGDAGLFMSRMLEFHDRALESAFLRDSAGAKRTRLKLYSLALIFIYAPPVFADLFGAPLSFLDVVVSRWSLVIGVGVASTFLTLGALRHWSVSFRTRFSVSFVFFVYFIGASSCPVSLSIHEIGDTINWVKFIIATSNHESMSSLRFKDCVFLDSYVNVLLLLFVLLFRPADQQVFGVLLPLFFALLFQFVSLRSAYRAELSYRLAWMLKNRSLLTQQRLAALRASQDELDTVNAAFHVQAGDADAEEAALLYSWNVPAASITFMAIIGSGTFAEVYHVLVDGRPAAAKRLHRLHQSDSESMQRFRREILVMSKLRHPQLALFYGATWEPPCVCVLMELFSEGSLYDALHNPSLVLGMLDPLLKWACNITSAMEYLHENSVVHRDLKSQNVMIAKDGGGKVVDLGEARSIKRDETMTSLGTPHWCAPEVLRGERYDEKCDVYSFGILLYELVARQVPYSKEPPARVLQGVCSGKLRPEMPVACPPALAALAARCWAHDAAARPRFPEVQGVLGALQLLLCGSVAPAARLVV